MKVEFNRRTEDLIAFYQFDGWYKLKKSQRFFTKVIWGLFAIVPYVIFILILMNSLKVTSVSGVIFIGLLFFFLGYVAAEPSLLRRYERVAKSLTKDKIGNDMLGPVCYILSAEEIQWSSEYSQGSSKYQTVKKVFEDKAHYYLTVASGAAWIIPKTAFQNEEDLSTFKQLFQLS